MDYTESEQQEIELMAEYTALYYGPRPGFSRVPSLLRPLSWTWVISGILGSSVIWQGRSLTRIQTTGQWGLGRKQPRRTMTTSTCAAPRLCYPQQNIVSSLAWRPPNLVWHKINKKSRIKLSGDHPLSSPGSSTMSLWSLSMCLMQHIFKIVIISKVLNLINNPTQKSGFVPPALGDGFFGGFERKLQKSS